MFEKETIRLYHSISEESLKNEGDWKHSPVENWKVDIFLSHLNVENLLNFRRSPLSGGTLNFPVFADPSHSTFKRSCVAAISRAAIAAGADGLLIEVHQTPKKAWVDPLQALEPGYFGKLIKQIEAIAKVLGKTL